MQTGGWEDVLSAKERCELETAQGHPLLCRELCSQQPGISLCSADLTAAEEHKCWQQLSHQNARGGAMEKTP